MFIKSLQLQNFRCFQNYGVSFEEAPVILIEGPNGSGKSSILEALHYLCYLRSFRTPTPKELLQHDAAHFFIKVALAEKSTINEANEFTPGQGRALVQVGFAGKRRIVKVDQRPVDSYQDLMNVYRVITFTEDDLFIIKGGPEIRRAFIDQAMVLIDPQFVQELRKFKSILEQRNALLSRPKVDRESYDLWTDRLREQSNIVTTRRRELLAELQQKVNELLSSLFENDLNPANTEGVDPLILSVSRSEMYRRVERADIPHIELAYQQKADTPDMDQEIRWQRSLFGAHLDDIAIDFRERKSKVYASRGQQKLITTLLKLALAKVLHQHHQSVHPIFLMDDFLTDFDQATIGRLLPLLVSPERQLILTCPTSLEGLDKHLAGYKVQKITL